MKKLLNIALIGVLLISSVGQVGAWSYPSFGGFKDAITRTFENAIQGEGPEQKRAIAIIATVSAGVGIAGFALYKQWDNLKNWWTGKVESTSEPTTPEPIEEKPGIEVLQTEEQVIEMPTEQTLEQPDLGAKKVTLGEEVFGDGHAYTPINYVYGNIEDTKNIIIIHEIKDEVNGFIGQIRADVRSNNNEKYPVGIHKLAQGLQEQGKSNVIVHYFAVNREYGQDNKDFDQTMADNIAGMNISDVEYVIGLNDKGIKRMMGVRAAAGLGEYVGLTDTSMDDPSTFASRVVGNLLNNVNFRSETTVLFEPSDATPEIFVNPKTLNTNEIYFLRYKSGLDVAQFSQPYLSPIKTQIIAFAKTPIFTDENMTPRTFDRNEFERLIYNNLNKLIDDIKELPRKYGRYNIFTDENLSEVEIQRVKGSEHPVFGTETTDESNFEELDAAKGKEWYSLQAPFSEWRSSWENALRLGYVTGSGIAEQSVALFGYTKKNTPIVAGKAYELGGTVLQGLSSAATSMYQQFPSRESIIEYGSLALGFAGGVLTSAYGYLPSVTGWFGGKEEEKTIPEGGKQEETGIELIGELSEEQELGVEPIKLSQFELAETAGITVVSNDIKDEVLEEGLEMMEDSQFLQLNVKNTKFLYNDNSSTDLVLWFQDLDKSEDVESFFKQYAASNEKNVDVYFVTANENFQYRQEIIARWWEFYFSNIVKKTNNNQDSLLLTFGRGFAAILKNAFDIKILLNGQFDRSRFHTFQWAVPKGSLYSDIDSKIDMNKLLGGYDNHSNVYSDNFVRYSKDNVPQMRNIKIKATKPDPQGNRTVLTINHLDDFLFSSDKNGYFEIQKIKNEIYNNNYDDFYIAWDMQGSYIIPILNYSQHPQYLQQDTDYAKYSRDMHKLLKQSDNYSRIDRGVDSSIFNQYWYRSEAPLSGAGNYWDE